jgi:hypothetical protein
MFVGDGIRTFCVFQTTATTITTTTGASQDAKQLTEHNDKPTITINKTTITTTTATDQQLLEAYRR